MSDLKRLPEWLIPSAKALLELDANGSLVPHGIGGHARTIIAEFIALHDQPTPPIHYVGMSGEKIIDAQ